jgi:type II secretory pathway pseudopilin PulG
MDKSTDQATVGHAALATQQLAKQQPGHGGFTLIELLSVMSTIFLLAAMLFPVFSRVRENVRRINCLNNVKQLGLGLMQYTQDFDEVYPMHSLDLRNTGLRHCSHMPRVLRYLIASSDKPRFSTAR